MKKGRSLTLRQALWVSILLTVASTVLGASALYGYQLYRGGHYSERLRVKAFAETYAAEVAPITLTGSSKDIKSFVDSINWHAHVCLLAVLGPNGEQIAVRGNTPLLARYLKLPGAQLPSAETQTWRIPADEENLMPELNLAASPIIPAGAGVSHGTLVCAARLSGDNPVPSSQVWSFFAGLMLIAATGIILGICGLKQSVIDPIAQLAERCRNPNNPGDNKVLPTEREDELGDLARVLSNMNVNLTEWRGRAANLERSMTQRVAAETQRITRELRQAEKEIWTDPLTKLSNRRCMDERFGDIFKSQCEAGQDLCIAMIDVDNFKTLNDTLGHKAGDDLLAFIGELLRQGLREQDLAIRYGGDEFVLVLPAVTIQDAAAIAERTIKLFAQQAKLLPVSPKPTMSAGIASLHKHRSLTPESLLRTADQALYDAKKSGKSQVVVFQANRAKATAAAVAQTNTRLL